MSVWQPQDCTLWRGLRTIHVPHRHSLAWDFVRKETARSGGSKLASEFE
jgi:hypothetical protein